MPRLGAEAGAHDLRGAREGGELVRGATLGQAAADHLVYRRGQEVAGDGRTLAMGALCLSRDAGDSWTAVSRDQPPEYCVRFG